MAGRVVRPLADGAALEGEQRVQGVLAGRLDGVREVRRPARVEAARPGRAGVAPHLLVEAGLAVDRADLAQVVAQDVGVVDAGVDGDRAVLLHVAPRRDDDPVAAVDAGLEHQARRPDRAVVDQGADQPVDRVAAVVLGDRDDLAGALGRLDDPVAAAQRDGQRLLAQEVQPGLQAGEGDGVVRAGVGRDAGRLDLRHLAGHRRDVGEDARPAPQQLGGLVGQEVGVLLVQIADGDQLDVREAGPVERCDAAQVPTAHAAAADERDLEAVRHRNPPGRTSPPTAARRDIGCADILSCEERGDVVIAAPPLLAGEGAGG